MPIDRSDYNSYTLLSNASSTGSAVKVRGGEYVVCALGTLSTATLTLQFQLPDGVTWAPLYSGGLLIQTSTAPMAHSNVVLPACDVRVAVTGTASGVYCWLIGVG